MCFDCSCVHCFLWFSTENSHISSDWVSEQAIKDSELSGQQTCCIRQVCRWLHHLGEETIFSGLITYIFKICVVYICEFIVSEKGGWPIYSCHIDGTPCPDFNVM